MVDGAVQLVMFLVEFYFLFSSLQKDVKSSQVCFIVNSSTCTGHTYRELKLRYSQTLGAYS